MRWKSDGVRLVIVMLFLAVLHFGLRPLIGSPRFERVAPDFLLLALLVYAIRARPGQGAIAGFVVGLLADALSPAAFGAGILAHTVIGYIAAWGKAVFFAENIVVNAAFFFFGTWLRDVLVLLVGRRTGGSALFWQVGYWSPLLATTTTVAGVLVLLMFRQWLHIRLSE